jgi:hypothetical protein
VGMGSFTFKIYNVMTIIVCALWKKEKKRKFTRALTIIVITLYFLYVKLPIPKQKPEDGHDVWSKHVAK